MRDLADGKIRRVIVYRLDRLSCSVSDFSDVGNSLNAIMWNFLP